MEKIRSILLMIAITTLSLSGSNAIAQEKKPLLLWKEGGIVINDSQGKNVRQNSRIISCGDDAFVVVWEDARNGYLDIYAQKFDKYGKILWGEDGVPVCTAQKNQSFPEIECTGTKGSDVIIVWQDYRNGYADIYAQRLDKNGTSQWEIDGIPICKASANQMAPKIANDGFNGAIITWFDYRGAKGEDIYAQKIYENGQIAWEENGIPICTAEGTQWYPKIIPDEAGGAIIVWDDKRSGVYDIFAQRISSEGSTVWGNNGFPICSAPENQEYSEIVKTPNGFVIVWQDSRNTNLDIYAQKIDISGKTLWKQNGTAVCNVLGNQERPRVVGGKDAIITWEDYRNSSINPDIYAQKLKDDGEPLWEKFGVPICETKERQEDPDIISDNEDGAIIYWKDYRTLLPSIYARRINKDGKPLWIKDGWALCRSVDAEHPKAASVNGTFMFTWQAKRDGNLDVFVQNIDLSGNCLWQEDGITINKNFGNVTQQKPKIVEVSPKEYVIVWEDYRNGLSTIYAQKFDNNGKLLWSRDGIRVCKFTCNQVEPRVIRADNRHVIIAWQDHRNRAPNIYVQKLDMNGDLVWGEDGMDVALSANNQLNPELISDGAEGAIVSWLDKTDNIKETCIQAQKIDGFGGKKWKKDGIQVCKNQGQQTEQKNISDGKGGIILVWTDFGRSLKNPDIYMQRISDTGEILWGTNGIPICQAPDIQRNPEIISNDDIIIAWEDSGSGNYDIYAQKIKKEGSVAWTPDGIEVCSAKYTQHDPKLAYDNDGGAVIIWEDYRNTNWDIYAQRVDSNGTRLWDISGVAISIEKSTQYSPQIISNKDKSSIIVWEDYRSEENYNIYAAKISPIGKHLWGNGGIPISSSKEGARNPQIVPDGEGGAIIVWTDFRLGNYDIYAQRVTGGRAE